MTRHDAQIRRFRITPHDVALATAAFTWPLLFVGGLVTTYKVGMAVPDWPTTFGINMFLYDMSNAAWGVLVEHGHRLYGAAVGAGTLALAVWFTLASGRSAWVPLVAGLLAALALGLVIRQRGGLDPLLAGISIGGPVSLGLAAWLGPIRRRWMAAFAWVLVAAVIAQGALGGLRVRMNSTDLAAVHGCAAQLFFAAVVALVVLTGRRWADAGPAEPDSAHLRRRTLVTLVLIYAQIVAGAWLRHYSGGLYVHSILALAVLAHVAVLGRSILIRGEGPPALRDAARALVALTAFQIALGVASWWVLRPWDGLPKPVTTAQALVRTAHQANGALVLAAAVVLAMRCVRSLEPARASGPATDRGHPLSAPVGP